MQHTASTSARVRQAGTFGISASTGECPRSYAIFRRAALLAAALLARAAPAPAAPGDLDAAFGDHGRVSLHIGSFGAQGRSVIQQPDGRLVIAGEAAGQFTIARLTRAGALDATFGGDGIASLDFGGFYDAGYVVLRQTDGKLVVAGAAGVAGSADGVSSDIGLARFNSNGTLDATFGEDGKVTLDLGGGADFASGLVQQPDGKLVVAGATNSSGTDRMAFARFNTDGTIDTTFGSGGTTVVDLGTGTESRANGLVRQQDGRLVAAGLALARGGTSDFAVVRITDDGLLDTTFDGDGWRVSDIGGGADSAASVAIQPDGKLVLAGLAFSTGDGLPDAALLRLSVDGSIDEAFGSAGKAVVDLGDQSTLDAIVAQPDGKLVATGTRGQGICCSDSPEPTDMILVRFDADGSLDQTYGVDGIATAVFSHSDSHLYMISSGAALLRQDDGRYVAVGGNSAGDVAIARFNDAMDSAGVVGFAESDQFLAETARSVSFRIRRTGGRTGAVSVAYDTVAGNAREGVDYLAAHGTLSWADDDATERTLAVDVIDDDEVEQFEDFALLLSNPSGGAGLAASVAPVGIRSGDGPGQLGFLFGLDLMYVEETAGKIQAIVRRLNGFEGAVSVQYAAIGDTAMAGSDFAAASGTLSWGDGDDSPRSIWVEILDDSSPEPAEDFTIRLSEPTGGATIPFLASIQRVRIAANDGREHGSLAFRTGGAPVAEDRASVVLTVSRRDGSTGAVSVDYATSAGSATSGADFDATSGTLRWPDGDAEDRTITVSIANDSTRERDETFDVTLSNPTGGASIAFPARATVTITDDDSTAAGDGSSGGGGGGCFIAAAALLLLWRRRVHITRS